MLTSILTFGAMTMRTPKSAAAELLRIRASRAQRYELALLVVVLGGLASRLLVGSNPAEDSEAGGQSWLASPFGAAAMEAGLLSIVVLGTTLVGRLFGGKATLDDSVLLISWLQLVSVFVQSALAIILQFLPLGLNGGMLTVGAVFYLFWMYVCFVTVLHGFQSTAKVFFGTLMIILGAAVGITSLLTVFFVT